MADPEAVERVDSESKLRELMDAIPAWYPGAWGPPAETLTYASIVVAAFGASFLLFHNQIDKVLFRFWFPPFYLAASATILSFIIALAAKGRPGSWPPRVWALLLTLGCGTLTVWGLIDALHRVRSSPLIHIFSLVGLMAALALAPRLFAISPFSFWVQHAAPASLVWALLVFVVAATVVSHRVIRTETERVRASIRVLEQLRDEIRRTTARSASAAEAASLLKGLDSISLTEALPDEYVWIAADVLRIDPRKEDSPLLSHSLEAALEDLTGAVGVAFQSSDAPKLSGAKVRSDDWMESHWTIKNAHFASNSALALEYYTQLTRLQAELDTQLRGSRLGDKYAGWSDPFTKKVNTLKKSLGEAWIAAVASGDPELLATPKLLEGRFEGSDIALGNLRQWKSLPWSAARSMLGHAGCATEQRFWTETTYKEVPIPNDIDHRTQQVPIQNNYHRVECYAYRSSAKGGGMELAAELHLSYHGIKEDGQTRGYGSPWSVRLYFDVPEGADPAVYENEVVQNIRANAGSVEFKSQRINRPGDGPCILIAVE
jgi:hypothetical protein